jgi:hypothetical protein
VSACPAGWFSLNVPSGLTLYWFINNIISTAMQLYMRNTIKVDVPALASDGAGPIIDVSSTVIKPKEDRSKQVRDTGRRGAVLAACDFCVRVLLSMGRRVLLHQDGGGGLQCMQSIGLYKHVVKPKDDRSRWQGQE